MPKVTIQELNKRIEGLYKEQKATAFDPKEHNDRTRSKIANIFTWGYLILVGFVVVLMPIYNMYLEPKLDIKELLVTISSIIGTPFGFIVGYYFKQSAIEK